MRNRRPLLVALAVAVAAASVIFIAIQAAGERQAEEAASVRREQREARSREREAERRQRLREESATLIPEELGGVALGMTKDEVRALRRGIRPKLGAGEPGLEMFEERLSNGAEVVYGFGEGETGLAQIQVLSALPSTDALVPHFNAMVERYGRPTGIWDCPNTGGVATRRFTWRRSRTTIADVFLLYGDRASVTLYIASSEAIGASLERSQCRPVQNREQLEAFPVTTLEQIRQSQDEAP